MVDYEAFVRKLQEGNIELALNGVAEEAGEIMGVIKRVRRGDYNINLIEGEPTSKHAALFGIGETLKKFNKPRMDLLKEIGDLHYYLTQLTILLDSNMDHVELLNVGKYYDRLKQDKLLGKGSNRESE